MLDKDLNDSSEISEHYGSEYFKWQKSIGEFGGWANSFKFKRTISPNHKVIDFGCGGGYLITNISCSQKVGIEPNRSAGVSAKQLGVTHFINSAAVTKELGTNFADVIISNHALEHTLNPLKELKDLHALLKPNGMIHFFVPCDSINYQYDPNDVNHHLFSWSPQNIGNLFTEAGYKVIYAKPYIHKWPPYYRVFAKLGWPIFNFICRIYGHLDRSWFQVEVKALKQ